MVSRANLVGLILWLLSFGAHAACSGSGLTWSCTAGSTVAEVNSAISSGSDGMTITMAAGSYTWTSGVISFSTTKGTTIKCATVRGCTVSTGGSTRLGMPGTAASGTNTRLYRISGFVFDGGGSTVSGVIWFYGTNAVMTKIVVDNNTFQNYGGNPIYMMFGDTSSIQNYYGVIYKNIFTGSGNGMAAHFYGAQQTSQGNKYPGTADAMFIEDNTFTFTTQSNTGHGCVDGWGGMSLVFRYNTATNCRHVLHGVVHDGGPWNSEVYRNTFNCTSGLTDCFRVIHWQGSAEMLAFDNTINPSGSNGSAIELLHYRSATPAAAGYNSADYQRCDGSSTNPVDGGGTFGYPCWRQPGRNASAQLKPVYVWNNKFGNGALAEVSVPNPWGQTNPSPTDHVAENRDYYNGVSANAQTSATSPFNGTVGVGFGTIARRPTTCTTGAESGGGVGYWTTDEGNWNGFIGGSQGRLYRCSATNTWTLHYTPYPYPHPLRVQMGPAAPTVN